MFERTKFVVAVESGEFSFAEQCRRFGISRKTGYKWLDRFSRDGLSGLEDLSRAPHCCPHETPRELAEAILCLKHKYPNWGPRKLRHKLYMLEPDKDWPANSTIGELLDRHGLVTPRKVRRRVPPSSAPLSHCQQSNDVWSADFKGQFQLGSRQWCYPLTVSDNHSRYLLACQGLLHPNDQGVRKQFERLFAEFGLPAAIRTDNGTPFASKALGGLTRLSIWWIKLGIRPERIKPGKPQQNGRHERMHRTLKQAATQPASANMSAQQKRFSLFMQEYNDERPHEALDNKTPAMVYTPSQRKMPSRLPGIEYDDEKVIRQVRTTGEIKWKGGLYFLSETLVGEPVGLQEIGCDRWQVYFGSVPLGILDERRGKVIRPT